MRKLLRELDEERAFSGGSGNVVESRITPSFNAQEKSVSGYRVF